MLKQVSLGLCVLLIGIACNLTATPPTAIPTADIPTVEILDPPNNRQVVEGIEFDIDIVARDSGAGIARIELLVDGELVNTAVPFTNITEPIFRAKMNWLAHGVGFHVLEAVAYRQDGQQSDAFLINVEVMPKPE